MTTSPPIKYWRGSIRRRSRPRSNFAKAALVSAKALLTQAMTNFERQAELIKSGYTTRRTYDQAEQELRTEEAAVDSAQAAVSTAEEQFGYAELKAGIAGIVTARNAETGQVVQAGQTIFKVAHDGPRDAVFDVYEALLNDPPSRRVQIYLQSDPSVATTGQVREISPTIDPASGTVKVKIVMDRVPPQMSLGSVVVGVATFPPARSRHTAAKCFVPMARCARGVAFRSADPNGHAQSH